jgi:hypothetical protein
MRAISSKYSCYIYQCSYDGRRIGQCACSSKILAQSFKMQPEIAWAWSYTGNNYIYIYIRIWCFLLARPCLIYLAYSFLLIHFFLRENFQLIYFLLSVDCCQLPCYSHSSLIDGSIFLECSAWANNLANPSCKAWTRWPTNSGMLSWNMIVDMHKSTASN